MSAVEEKHVATVAENPLKASGSARYTLFPLKDELMEIWNHYKAQQRNFWTAEEIDMSKDRAAFELLTKDEQHFVLMVLAFFAASDGIVMRNISENFLSEVEAPEAVTCYSWQNMMEGIHSETYSLLVENYLEDQKEKLKIFAAIENFPIIKKKADWALQWLEEETASFPERLVAYACVEGIHFSGSFCAVFWLKKRKKGLDGLFLANELISRDEGQHTEYAFMLNRLLRKYNQALDGHRILEIVQEAVEVEKEFVCDALPVALIGMNQDLMCQYIEFVADRVLVNLGAQRHYGSSNPFPWMDTISMVGKTNFFEKRLGDYGLANVKTQKTEHSNKFEFVADF